MKLVPHGAQNAFEFLVEFLYRWVEMIVGPKLAPKCFPLLATLFIFILTANWFGLLPGVSTFGEGEPTGIPLLVKEVERPLLRPATADINMNAGMAIAFMVVWLVITIQEVGVIGFLKHLFAPKGKMNNPFMMFVMGIIFFGVGIIEVISILIRPVSLSLRLYGNIFAGENLLHTMMTMLNGTHPVVEWAGRILLPIPFYFMELLVGLVQTVVFTLLCAVYVMLSTSHDEDHDAEHAH
jgi:F-type H+-transporting ATPase subunit a